MPILEIVKVSELVAPTIKVPKSKLISDNPISGIPITFNVHGTTTSGVSGSLLVTTNSDVYLPPINPVVINSTSIVSSLVAATLPEVGLKDNQFVLACPPPPMFMSSRYPTEPVE